jgi:RNA polymerase sigma factor (sigma-70 family)
LRQGSRAHLRDAADDRLVALVRRGDPTAFEILYDRHIRDLLSFCRYMLGSHVDAEDAVQSTFASAHRALLADDRLIDLRPWLFTIARNACLSILRGRRPAVEAEGALPSREDPVARVEQREDMRQMLATLLELPERQRTALVLSELHGFGQAEIGALLGVRTEQVKSYVFQARSNLISEREARNADCVVIREELSQARGPALLRSRLRRHLRSCPGCQEYAQGIARQRHQLGILLPVVPSLALKRRALEAALGEASGSGMYAGGVAVSSSVAATTAELAGGGAKVLVAKLLVGIACVGASTGAATVVLGLPASPSRPTVPPSSARVSARPRLASFVRSAEESSMSAPRQRSGVAPASVGARGRQPVVVPLPHLQASHSSAEGTHTAASPAGSLDGPPVARKAKSGEAHGGSEEVHRKSEGPPGKSGEAHGGSGEAPGKSGEAPGKSGEALGKSGEALGKSGEALGKSGEAHGGSGEAHGGSGEAHGGSEEAPGKSEEEHGKAARE